MDDKSKQSPAEEENHGLIDQTMVDECIVQIALKEDDSHDHKKEDDSHDHKKDDDLGDYRDVKDHGVKNYGTKDHGTRHHGMLKDQGEVKNLSQGKPLEDIPNPLTVNNIVKNNKIFNLKNEETFEIDVNSQAFNVQKDVKKSKNIISNFEIDVAKKQIKNNLPALDVVDSIDSTEFVVNERLSTKEKIFKDANMSTVPSVIRMNVKFPRENPSISNMSISAMDQVPANYKQEAVIVVNDSTHMVVDESRSGQKSRPIVVDETKTSIEKMDVSHGRSQPSSMSGISRMFSDPSMQKSRSTHESSRISLKETTADFSQWMHHQMPERNEQRNFYHGYDNSRINLDEYDPIAPDLLDQINVEAALDCAEEDDEDANLVPLNYALVSDTHKNLSWHSAHSFYTPRQDFLKQEDVMGAQYMEADKLSPKVFTYKNCKENLVKNQQLLEDLQTQDKRIQNSMAICNICKRKFNLWTGELLPQHSRSYHGMLPQEDSQQPFTPKVTQVDVPAMKSAPEYKKEKTYEEEYGMPCEALHPIRKKRLPVPTTRQTRSMTMKKFKQNQGLALNPATQSDLKNPMARLLQEQLNDQFSEDSSERCGEVAAKFKALSPEDRIKAVRMIATIKEDEALDDDQGQEEPGDIDILDNNMSNNCDENNHNADIADRYMRVILGIRLWEQISPLLSEKFKNEIGQAFRQQFARDQEDLRLLEVDISQRYGVPMPIPDNPVNEEGQHALEELHQEMDRLQRKSKRSRISIVKWLARIPKNVTLVDYYTNMLRTANRDPIALPRNQSIPRLDRTINYQNDNDQLANLTASGYANSCLQQSTPILPVMDSIQVPMPRQPPIPAPIIPMQPVRAQNVQPMQAMQPIQAQVLPQPVMPAPVQGLQPQVQAPNPQEEISKQLERYSAANGSHAE